MKRLIAVLVLASCAPAAKPAATPAAPAASTAPTFPRELHWFRNSAEYRALSLQTYRAATARVRELSQGLQPGSWAVILDVDETALENSDFRVRLINAGGDPNTFTDSMWYSWIRERAAREVPGAAQFTNVVHQLGGRVVFVTNRDDVVCDDTKANLLQLGFTADIMLCRAKKFSDKNPRFEAVQRGSGETGGSPMRVVVWVGDNILDFPALAQTARTQAGGLDLFGDRYFLLPNPIYGSWQRNPQE